jgi:signal transduction histidine kinase
MMRLADFIEANVESILVEWETFARSIWPGPATDPAELRDHAEDILRATARDMMTDQTLLQQSNKSKGIDHDDTPGCRLDTASDRHGAGRVASGFSVMEVVAEYRALRASVLRLWHESMPEPDRNDINDLARFNEAIDQSLAEAVRSFAQGVDQSRHLFLAILGHDLRNPLNAMTMSAQALLQEQPADSDSFQDAAQIVNSGTAMARMIDDLLTFTAAGLGGEMPLSRAAMDLGLLCREVIDEIQAAFPAWTVHQENHGDLTGQWDTQRMRQVVSNLLRNAIQYGGTDCNVKLHIRGEESHVEFAVSNHGPAIPPEVLAVIFDPLRRIAARETHRQRQPGSIGLGLYIVHQIVSAHRGTIDVASSSAAGTTFTVRIPRNAARR